MTRRTVFLLAFGLLITSVICAQSSGSLHKIHKIHVASMGSGSDAARFQSLLQDELRNVGFEISGASVDADATLTGEFSSESHGDSSLAHATLRLKSTDGKRTLWNGDYVSQHRGSIAEDVVKTLAQTCAERFRHDWAKD